MVVELEESSQNDEKGAAAAPGQKMAGGCFGAMVDMMEMDENLLHVRS